MLYKFKSKATGDLIMLAPQGDALMRVLGREPATQGIIEVAHMPQAMAAIEQAVAADEAVRQSGHGTVQSDAGSEAERTADPGLRQRLWPMLEMLRRAQGANEPVVWGV